MLSTQKGPYKMINKISYKLEPQHLALYQTDIPQISAHSFISNINVAYRSCPDVSFFQWFLLVYDQSHLSCPVLSNVFATLKHNILKPKPNACEMLTVHYI